MGTNRERLDTQKATLYDLRMIVKQSEKETYTKDEMMDLIDSVMLAKEQENA